MVYLKMEQWNEHNAFKAHRHNTDRAFYISPFWLIWNETLSKQRCTLLSFSQLKAREDMQSTQAWSATVVKGCYVFIPFLTV